MSFVTALRSDDVAALEAIMGSEAHDVLDSGDAVADRAGRQRFVALYDERHRLDRIEDRTILHIGEFDWPFPIPIVLEGDRWVFDSDSGKQELLDRRIGRNELAAIEVCLAIVDAQVEYASEDRDGDGLLEYARVAWSEPGKKNGLFWPTEKGQKESPLGPMAVRAVAEGYRSDDDPSAQQPFHGYYYKLLEGQGPNAAGGAFEYLVREDMIGGFAVIAWPAVYGVSGIVTFAVNHDGVVFQKDLGDETEALAPKVGWFDPDSTWKKVQ